MDCYCIFNFSSQKTYTPVVILYFLFTDAPFLLQILFIWQHIDQQDWFTVLSCQLLHSYGSSIIISSSKLTRKSLSSMEQFFRCELNAVIWNNQLYSILQMLVLELVKLFIDFSFTLPPANSEYGLKQTAGSPQSWYAEVSGGKKSLIKSLYMTTITKVKYFYLQLSVRKSQWVNFTWRLTLLTAIKLQSPIYQLPLPLPSNSQGTYFWNLIFILKAELITFLCIHLFSRKFLPPSLKCWYTKLN